MEILYIVVLMIFVFTFGELILKSLFDEEE